MLKLTNFGPLPAFSVKSSAFGFGLLELDFKRIFGMILIFWGGSGGVEERAYFYGHKIRDRSLFSKERLFSGRGGPLCLGGGCFLSSTLGKAI